jgi:ion channel-forming bestrophin family protein
VGGTTSAPVYLWIPREKKFFTMQFAESFNSLFASKTLGYVTGLAALAGLYACLPLLLEWRIPGSNQIPSQFHAALSLVLGWLLVFRTNTAYNRWWEARTLWGALVNASRNLSLKLVQLGELAPSERELCNRLIVAFPIALRCHLRSEIDTKLPPSAKQLIRSAKHAPLALAQQLYAVVGHAKRDGRIDGEELRVFDAELLRLMDVCGGCERILKTRIVRSYRVFARQCVLLFLATLPWGVARDFGMWGVLITFISAYFMLGLETVAEHVEEPFGYDEDDLDLDSLCSTIEVSVGEVFVNGQVSQTLAVYK